LSTRVANAIETFYGGGNRATVQFIRYFDKFVDCLNVRSMKEGIYQRKPDLLPYNNVDDPRLKWLMQDFLSYLDKWDEFVDQRDHISKSDKNRMKLCRETLQGIRITVNSFVQVTKYLLSQPGVKCVLSERFNQDPLEAYFGNHRQMKGGNDAPSVVQFCQNANALQLKSSNLLRVSGSNVRISGDAPIDNSPLPNRRRNNTV
ncbi:uncharacterized protein LOC144360480, partial [Saccoglossus kowalevskii]